MSNCPSNTIVRAVVQYGPISASNVQGMINRIKTYWDKYNNTAIRTERKIGYKYTKYDRSTDIQYTSVLTSLIQEIRTTLDNYKDKADNSGGDYSWSSLTQYDSAAAAKVNELRVNLLALESQCWACHTGDNNPTCSHCYSSADSCSTGDNCSCYSTCYTYSCACYNSCYGQTCVCNATCYTGYSACTCNMTSYNAGVYTYTAFCGCNNACYGYAACSTCHGLCYDQQGACTTCDSTCYTFSCSCNASCNGHSCSCNTTCYLYDEDCRICYGTTY